MRLDTRYDRPPGEVRPESSELRRAAEQAARVRYGGRGLASLTRLAGGFCNHNHLVVLDGGAQFVLRSSTRSAHAVQTEIDVLRLVADQVPVPTVEWTDLARGAWRHVAMSWMPGERLDIVEDELGPASLEAVVRELGGVLARISSHPLDGPGLLGPGPVVERPIPADAGRRYLEAALDDPRLALRLGAPATHHLAALVAQRSDLFEGAAATGLCHSDFNAKNLLVTPDRGGWRVSAVLDWEFALSSSPLGDLGNFLRFEGLAPSAQPDWISRGFEESGGTLPPDWRARARAADLLALCSFLCRDETLPRTFATARGCIESTLKALSEAPRAE